MKGSGQQSTGQESVAQPLATALASLAGLAGACRIGTFLLPAFSNFNFVGAMCLFGGARLKSWRAYAIPLAILLITNGLFGLLVRKQYFLDPTLLFVYPSFLVYIFIGKWLRHSESPLKIGIASLLGSVQFFLLTNFAVWLFWGVGPGYTGTLEPGQYPRTVAGLIACYAAGLGSQNGTGLSFFAMTVLGDLFCTGALFGLHAILSRVYFQGERVLPLPQLDPAA
jgi:hypothetical protein